MRLHPELRSPFRLAPDGYGSALLLLAPESESEGEEGICGVARLPADGAFGGWLVTAGERAGSVLCPFDLALLPDGRFAVADLPLGQPPDVRIQIFGPDGRLSAILVEDALSLAEKQTAWFQRVLREGSAYEKARVHHDCGAGAPDHGAEAERLYRAVLASSPRHLQALWGLATLLADNLNRPDEAEKHFLEAIAAGGAAGDLTARMAECRRARGDLDGAIALLHGAIDGPNPPEEYHSLLDVLGGYYLERAGESSEGMI